LIARICQQLVTQNQTPALMLPRHLGIITFHHLCALKRAISPAQHAIIA
jgi:hypothetical protein